MDDFSRVYMVDADHLAEPPVALTPEDMDCSFPSWSPDGEKIVVSCEVGIYEYSSFLLNSDGTGFTNLGIHASGIWSPDGEKLIFTSTEGSGLGKMIGWEFCTTDALFAYDLKTQVVTRLTWKENECIWWHTWFPPVR